MPSEQQSPSATPAPSPLSLPRSQALFEEALRLMPGGVNSPVRAFRSVGGTPPFIERGEGSRLFDVDGNSYIDYVQSWGAMILGHAHPRVVEAVREAAARGTSYGAPTEAENRLARLIIDAVPSIEMVRFVNSGTEAVMSALRLARGATGRPLVVKFEGCYHGHSDGMLVRAGSGAAIGEGGTVAAATPSAPAAPAAPGVSPAAASETLLARYNDLGSVEALFAQYGDRIAAVIVEPVAGNMGVVLPEEGFLEGLRAITRRHGSLLIFDEVITGFRLGLGGAQERYGVMPDLTCLGKIIGGGLPVGAYGGPRALMEQVSPAGPVYQAGTLSGNPLAMAAGAATLAVLRDGGSAAEEAGGRPSSATGEPLSPHRSPYHLLERRAQKLAAGLQTAAQRARIPLSVVQVGAMLGLFFLPSPPRNFDEAKAADAKRYARFFHGMLRRGVYLAPALLEATFIGLAHSDADIEATIAAAEAALSAMD